MRAACIVIVLALVVAVNVDAVTFRTDRSAIVAGAKSGLGRPYRQPVPCVSFKYGVCTNFVMYALTGDSCACSGQLWLVRNWQGKTMNRKPTSQCQPGDVILGKDYRHVGIYVSSREFCHTGSPKRLSNCYTYSPALVWTRGYWCVDPLTSCYGGSGATTGGSTSTNTNSGGSSYRNDAACANRNGQCKDVSQCRSPKRVQSGLCPSSGASVKCCL